ncbi:MAG: DUF1684 domain-containing protein [Acidobacteria bacterium]|nr:DUF1684 domain-containing protein [Acidobacteriota bacterium]MCI0620769.1 DUF1684 domain-containing protein [Acidobacteriota bacterium]MCI0720169.1 DUF1684 domain-containing protein [Acidobacteriota bacterium]
MIHKPHSRRNIPGSADFPCADGICPAGEREPAPAFRRSRDTGPPDGRSALPGTICLFVLAAVWASSVAATDKALQEDIDYRKERAVWMRSEKSPLALAGLFWLKAGRNSFGTDRGNDFVLPPESAPGRVGHFELKGNRASVEIESGVTVTLNGQQIGLRELKTDADGSQPDILHLNVLRMKVIERGGRLAVRLVNLKNPRLLEFQRADFFEIDPAFRVEAKFLPYQPAKKIKVATVTGYIEELECPGAAQFTLGGTTVQLEPVFETPGDTKLYFMFKDETNGRETYGGGRYLYTELPRNGRVTLNFNQAHNPYCAYNSYSTCQIPPLQNWLRVPIRAGEKKYPEAK